jgi:integrase
MAYAKWKVDSRGERRRVLVARWKDASGRWVEERRANDRTKAQTLEYARDRERDAELQRKGLAIAVRPVALGEIWDRWWEGDGSRRRSESKHAFRASLQKHVGELREYVLTPGTAGAFAERLDALLAAKAESGELAPQTLNHLRAGVHRMFEYAKDPKVSLWTGENPVRWVKRRRVPRTRKATLAAHEVQRVLEALTLPWRSAAGVCIYAGARPGEAFGLRKADVDLERGELTFRHSWSEPMPKDEEPRTVLIVPELGAILDQAMRASSSELVFPRVDGKPFAEETRWQFEDHLERALKSAEVVDGYEHTCRRCKARSMKGEQLEHTWRHSDRLQRACPSCSMKLWIRPIPRKGLTPYKLRHTHATLLRRGGVDLGTVQRALGHSDPRITAATYDHSELADRRSEIERVLTFGRAAGPHGAPVGRGNDADEDEARDGPETRGTPRALMVGATGFEPATTCTPSKCATRLRYAPETPPLCPPLSARSRTTKNTRRRGSTRRNPRPRRRSNPRRNPSRAWGCSTSRPYSAPPSGPGSDGR